MSECSIVLALPAPVMKTWLLSVLVRPAPTVYVPTKRALNCSLSELALGQISRRGQRRVVDASVRIEQRTLILRNCDRRVGCVLRCRSMLACACLRRCCFAAMTSVIPESKSRRSHCSTPGRCSRAIRRPIFPSLRSRPPAGPPAAVPIAPQLSTRPSVSDQSR